MKLVSNQFSPNILFADSMHALGQIFRIFRKKKVMDFSEHFGTKNYALFNTARSALGTLLHIFEIDPTKKIGIPAFSCCVMATPFLNAGFKIEWIDVDDRGVIDIEDFERKADKIGLVLVPHVFGQKAPVKAIYDIAKTKDMYVVKDGAHLFDTDVTDCDAVILSFGREKAVSCISGGALLWPSDSKHRQGFVTRTIGLKASSTLWIWRHLWQPFWFSIALPVWEIPMKFFHVPFGKGLLFFLKDLKMLPKAVTEKEKRGKEDVPVSKLAYPMQKVLERQLIQKDEQIQHQKEMAQHWKQALERLFPEQEIIIPEDGFRVILMCKGHEQKRWIQAVSRTEAFYLFDWEGFPIAPAGVKNEAFGYKEGQCPKAEYYAAHYLTFPTNKRVEPEDIARYEPYLAERLKNYV